MRRALLTPGIAAAPPGHTGDIVQSNSGSSGSGASGTSFTASLPSATGGNDVLLFIFNTGDDLPTSVGFSNIASLTGGTAGSMLNVLRKSGSTGETSWSVAIEAGNVFSWIAVETDTTGVDTPVPAGTSATSGTTITSAAKTTSTADVLLLAFFVSSGLGASPGTWSGYTSSFTEVREQARTTNGSLDVSCALASRAVTATGTYSTTATCTTSFSGSNPGASLLIPLTY